MATLTFRTDEQVDAALRDLMSDHSDRSTAIRQAILVAWRLRQAEALRAEATSLTEDDEDLAEMRSVQIDLEALRAW